jgi:hypothetical protein
MRKTVQDVHRLVQISRQLIGLFCAEVPFDQVGSGDVVGVTPGRLNLAPPRDPGDAGLAHEAGHPLLVGGSSLLGQGGRDPGNAIAPPALLPEVINGVGQIRIVEIGSAGPLTPLAPLVVGRA